jgi:electron transport complex protein RnfG
MLKKVWLYIEQSWLLIVSSFVFGLLIAVTNAAWQPRIEQNKKDKLNKLMKVLIADAKFELAVPDVQVDLGRGKFAKSDVYKAIGPDGSCKGYCFGAEGSGFADKIELVIAVDAAFEKIEGYSVLSSNETPGFGDRIVNDFYRRQFIGAPFGKLNLEKKGDDKKIDDEIIAISGATVSSTAVVNIFNNYLEQIKSKITAEGTGIDGK